MALCEDSLSCLTPNVPLPPNFQILLADTLRYIRRGIGGDLFRVVPLILLGALPLPLQSTLPPQAHVCTISDVKRQEDRQQRSNLFTAETQEPADLDQLSIYLRTMVVS